MTESGDPPPVPPREPDPAECCGRGCDPCVWDLYFDALGRYEAALKAWNENAGRSPRSESDVPGS